MNEDTISHRSEVHFSSLFDRALYCIASFTQDMDLCIGHQKGKLYGLERICKLACFLLYF